MSVLKRGARQAMGAESCRIVGVNRILNFPTSCPSVVRGCFRPRNSASDQSGLAGVLLLCMLVGQAIVVVQSARAFPDVVEIEIDASAEQDSLTSQLQQVNYSTFLPSRYFELAAEHDLSLLNWFSVSCGGLHTCAIKRYFDKNIARYANGNLQSDTPDNAPGQIFCWGMNKYGQLNAVKPFGKQERDLCTPESNRAVCFNWDDGYRNVSAGFLHTCGILADGRLFCWGNNLHNETGHDELLEPNGLTCSDPERHWGCQASFAGKWALTKFGGVSAGKHQTCAIRCVSDLRRYQYFDTWSSQGSEPNKWDSLPPSTCTEGEVVCWGKDQLKQGMSGLTEALGPDPPQDFQSVCAADVHSCAVRKEGSIYCWGYHGNNRITIPERLRNRKWSAVKCSGAHTCALMMPDQNGRSSLECWGHNGHGQTNVPRYTSMINVPRNGSTVPEVRKLIYDRSFLTFDTGEFNTCALWEMTNDEQTCQPEFQRSPALNGECWGDGSYSQNNLPMRPLGHKPKNICEMMQWQSISTGSYHTCGITIDDAGTTCAKDSVCTDYPPPYGDNVNYDKCPRGTKLNPGEVTTCVPTRTNVLRCWGLNSDLQIVVIGAGTTLRFGVAILLLPLTLLATGIH